MALGSLGNNPFISLLYDCILFEFASTVSSGRTVDIPLRTLTDSFSHVLRLYRADGIARRFYIRVTDVEQDLEKLSSLATLEAYIRNQVDGCFDLFPYKVTLGTASSAYMDIDEFLGLSSPSASLSVPGLTHCERHRFLWEYGQNVPTAYHDDISLLIQSLRDNVWNTRGSNGDSCRLQCGSLGVLKFSRNYDRNRQLEHRQQDLRAAESLDGLHNLWSIGTGIHDRIHTYIYNLDRTLVSSNHDTVEKLRQRLETELRSHFGRQEFRVDLFGSYKSGLSTQTSDADFTLMGDPVDVPSISDLGRFLRAYGYTDVIPIQGARVPIAMFVDPRTRIRCDININQPLGVHNSELIATYRKIDYRVRPLWLALRQIAKGNNILDGKNGFLTSYALTLMLITFLQNVTVPAILPSLQNPPFEDVWSSASSTTSQQKRNASNMVDIMADNWNCTFDHNWGRYRHFGKSNTKSVAELLIEFCNYFGNVFDYQQMEANPRLGRVQQRLPQNRRRNNSGLSFPDNFICIMDPFIRNRNVANNCRWTNAQTVKGCFRDTHTALIQGNVDVAFAP